jgi:hypothetical protein
MGLSPVAEAEALFVRPVERQTDGLLEGTLVWIVTVAEAPGARVPGVQVRLPDDMEQFAPVL